MPRGRSRLYRPHGSAFTLVELLVVIGIIAVLVGILLPVLSKAQRAAQSLKCMANLRTLGQAMQSYASENRGWIIGSGVTSGLSFYPQLFNTVVVNAAPAAYGNGNIPPLASIYPSDYITPIIIQLRLLPMTAKVLNDPNEGNRYFEYTQMPLFQCPSHQGALVSPSGGTWAGRVQGLSYVTAWAFLLQGPFQVPDFGGVTGATRISSAVGRWPQTPPAYTPKISKIGSAGKKIFMADGAKGFIFKSTFGTAPFPPGSYDLTIGAGQWYDDNNGSRGSFTDLGPWSLISGAYDRTSNPVNGNHSYSFDPRTVAYRHGGRRNGSFRMNAVFFDGHVENLGELESADPALWLPKGSVTPTQPAQFVYPDVQKQYLNSSPTGVLIQQ